MEFIKLYDSFKQKHYGSAGIVFIHDDKILLVHASKDAYGTWSYPKGRIDKNEEVIDASLREVSEEIGVNIPKTNIERLELKETKPVQKVNGIKHYWFYTYYLTDIEFEEYFDNIYEMDINKLQVDEIDQAKFFTKNEARKVLPKKFRAILEY